MVLIVDHYDSFTYNLYQLFREEVDDVRVTRSDKINVNEIRKMDPDHIVLSPGPGKPEDAGEFMEIVRHFKDKKPILGICLGHQAIMAEAGVPIIKAKEVIHGKSDKIIHQQTSLFEGIKADFQAIRYHSLVVEKERIPSDFTITAHSESDEVMAVEHRRLNCVGIQFHPESIGTEYGKKLIQNFLKNKKKATGSDLIKRMLKHALSFSQAVETMEALMEGKLDEAKIAAMMTVFNFRTITSEELAGFASVMRQKALSFPKPETDEIRIDTCGTGGAAKKSFNVSTTSAFVLAAAGLNVVKHGNRAVTSKSGSMDLLEKLGIDIQLKPEDSYKLLKKHGMAFLYAPLYHAAMKYASSTRKSLAVKSFFNLLGPLSNPAQPTHQIIGIYKKEYLKTICETLQRLHVKRAMIVSSEEGMDEISICDKTQICELMDQKIVQYSITPEDFGIKRRCFDAIMGSDPQTNVKITQEILNMSSKSSLTDKEQARLEMVAVNAGAGLYITGKANSLKEGFELAQQTILSEKAKEKLLQVKAFKGGCDESNPR